MDTPPLPALLEENPVVASVKDAEGLEAVLRSDCRVVFLLYGTVLDLPEIVARLKEDGRTVLVNVDLLEGFAGKEIVVRYVKEKTAADGVLSSKAFMVRAARELGLYAVHRFFLIDSLSYRKLAPQVRSSQADCVEILPGCMPRVISWVVADIDVPLIAGGLVCDRDDVFAALKAGAAAIASSNTDVWEM
ncbi:glycerol-3-phosphate responsive antiterminator [Streptomyces sp. NPDC005047]|uniref:glycerol-3-phosphate responsive antiterminator n=1 Tax=unclassified Streptomyces TaxID=2593676 RepID=UPI001F289755|nr:glycerol-3-phosphate responsive antiterminator [Streptomyces sp. WAC 04229]MCF2128271.1 glycerol-3-phosphate responsive antiterminator [Streptomyces sp. STD 3.1]